MSYLNDAGTPIRNMAYLFTDAHGTALPNQRALGIPVLATAVCARTNGVTYGMSAIAGKKTMWQSCP